MHNLLRKNIFNRQLENNERLQIAFDKKNKVERIFNESGEDIVYKNRKDKIEFQRIGTLFLDYLSDDVSDICNNFLEDVMSLNIKDIKEKYINTYIFYFKYFFEDKYNMEQLEYIKSTPINQSNEIKNIIIDKIKSIEDVTTLENLVNTYNNIMPQSKKTRIGNNFKNINDDNIHIALTGKFAKISRYFFKIAYIKQLYKLIIDYCYFKISVFKVNDEKNNVEKRNITQRYYYLKSKYDELLNNTRNNDNILQLSLPLPQAIATITENGEIMYCYQIDEIENINNLITNIFFNISFINLLESKQDLFRCKLCGSYNILKKLGTEYCNNISQQSENQTCSEYMKNQKASKKIKDNEISKEEKRYYDRLNNQIKPYLDEEKKQEQKQKIKDKRNKKKLKYKNGELSENEYLKWLRNQKKLEDILSKNS